MSLRSYYYDTYGKCKDIVEKLMATSQNSQSPV